MEDVSKLREHKALLEATLSTVSEGSDRSKALLEDLAETTKLILSIEESDSRIQSEHDKVLIEQERLKEEKRSNWGRVGQWVGGALLTVGAFWLSWFGSDEHVMNKDTWNSFKDFNRRKF